MLNNTGINNCPNCGRETTTIYYIDGHGYCGYCKPKDPPVYYVTRFEVGEGLSFEFAQGSEIQIANRRFRLILGHWAEIIEGLPLEEK